MAGVVKRPRNILALVILFSFIPTIEGGPNVRILVCDYNASRIVEILVTDTVEERTLLQSPQPWAVTFDPVENEIYWTSHGDNWIKKADMENTTQMNVVQCTNCFGLALDSQTRQLFYTERDTSSINVLKLGSQQGRMIVNASKPYGITLDERHRIIYWISNQGIWSASYDGSNIQQIVKLRQTMPRSVAFELGKWYWGEYSTNSVLGFQNIRQQLTSFVIRMEADAEYAGLFMFNGTLYVTNTFSRSVVSMLPEPGSAQTVITNSLSAPAGLFVSSLLLPAPPSPEVNIQLINTGNSISELEFHCNTSQQAEAVTYKTNWFVDSRLIRTTPPGSWDGGNVIQTQRLRESHLMAVFITSFGFEVSCSIETTDSNGTVTTSAVSKSKFVGIKVSNTAVIGQGGSANLTLQLTAPFGCGSNTNLAECKLFIQVNTPDSSSNCSNDSVLLPVTCGAMFVADQWNEPVSITVFAQITNTYGVFSKDVSVTLRTSVFPYHAKWGNYTLLAVVTVRKRSTYIERKSCYSNNDPHLKTFDGRGYEHQYLGIFTFYKHATLPLEVQIQTSSCGSRAYCNCGLAVRAGRTVFEFNRCPGDSATWTIGYTLCRDEGSVLDVRRRGGYYEIYLPTGAKVQVYAYGGFLNVHMFPSIQDVEQSVGLCGRLSANDNCSDDFFLRNGSYSTDPTADADCGAGYRVWQNVLIQFSNSWRVDYNDSLFNVDNTTVLTTWPVTQVVCSCSDGGGSNCSADNSYKACKTLPDYIDVSSSKCTIQSITTSRRKRRSISEDVVPAHRAKRQLGGSWPPGWTLALATAHCEKLFNNSRTVQVCQGIDGVETNGSLDNCILDIRLNGTTAFGIYALDTIRSKCHNEILVNPALSVPGPSGRSVYDIVLAETCPGDCNGNGSCVQGKCVCEPNYGGEDCSIDLTVGPVLVEVGTDGLCDTKTEDCSSTFVRGETFVDNGAMCRIQEIMFKRSGQKDKGSTVVAAETESIGSVKCKLPNRARTNCIEFVTGFRISVANSGSTFGNNLTLMLFDSTCIKPNVTGLTWTVEDRYCVYKGICVPDKQNPPGDPSLWCRAPGDGSSCFVRERDGICGCQCLKPVWRELSFLAWLAFLYIYM